MTDALFDINDDGEDRGYDADPLDVLTLKLRTQPSQATTARFQVFDAAGFDADADPIVNPPRKSKGADDILLDNGIVIASSVSPETTDAEVTTTLPNQTGVGWIIRCVVNGGTRRVGDRIVLDPSLIHERMVVIRTASGRRPIIATETIQYELDGWAGEFSDAILSAIGPTGPTGAAGTNGATGATGATGTFSAATGSSNGYASRTVYRFAQNGTQWTVATDIPIGNELDFTGDAPGGGGASGAAIVSAGSTGGTSASHSAAGGQGARDRRRYSRGYLVGLLANGPITFNIPDGGAAGAQTSRSTAGTTIGNGGNPASADLSVTALDALGNVITLLFAGRGGGGRAHSTSTDATAGGAGGGLLGAGGGGPANGASSNGGPPIFAATANTAHSQGDGGAGQSTSQRDGYASGKRGGASGAMGAQANGVAGAGGQSTNGGGGGGAGGGCNTGAELDGGDGGGCKVIGISGGGGLKGLAGTGTAATSGTAGRDADEEHGGEGGGGGGGAQGDGAAQTGGAGGAGGKGGGGGGGSGVAIAGNGNTATSPAGGKGGEAQVLILGVPG